MSMGNRLLETTADLAAALDQSKLTRANEGVKASQPRTAPGRMLAVREAMLTMQAEIEEMRRRLEHFDGSLPTIRIDPKKVRTTRWANRHEASFATAAFVRLKESIALSGGSPTCPGSPSRTGRIRGGFRASPSSRVPRTWVASLGRGLELPDERPGPLPVNGSGES